MPHYPTNTEYVAKGNPPITGVRFYGRTNRNIALSEYLDSEHELWQATRRNSHPLSDLKENYNTVGGVLFTQSDLGTLGRDLFRRSDLLDIDMVIKVANEEPSLYEANDSGKRGTRELYPIQVTVAAIYKDGVILRGGGTALSFVETNT